MILKDLEGISRGLIEVLSGETEDNHEELIQGCKCPGRDSNRPSPEWAKERYCNSNHIV
jgi:hypothetical protein